jgi:hypothetical protein
MKIISRSELAEVFDDIILGRGVHRSEHDLEYEGSLFIDLFIERMRLYKFFPLTLKDIQVEIGFKIPAFYLQGKSAIFGYVLREPDPNQIGKKIWCSAAFNQEGSNKYQIPEESEQVIFAAVCRPESFE